MAAIALDICSDGNPSGSGAYIQISTPMGRDGIIGRSELLPSFSITLDICSDGIPSRSGAYIQISTPMGRDGIVGRSEPFATTNDRMAPIPPLDPGSRTYDAHP